MFSSNRFSIRARSPKFGERQSPTGYSEGAGQLTPTGGSPGNATVLRQEQKVPVRALPVSTTPFGSDDTMTLLDAHSTDRDDANSTSSLAGLANRISILALQRACGPTSAWQHAILSTLAVYGLLSAIALLATRQLELLGLLSAAAVTAALIILYAVPLRIVCVSVTGGGDSSADVGAFVNPLWHGERETWRDVEGGRPGMRDRTGMLTPPPSPMKSAAAAAPAPTSAANTTVIVSAPAPTTPPPTTSPSAVAAADTVGEGVSSPTAVMATTRRASLSTPGALDITNVEMLPVQHLGAFYASEGAENSLGGGLLHDYLEWTGVDDVVLADVVRTVRMAPTSRAYLRGGPRKTLYFNPKQVRAAVVTCGGLCPGLNNIIREITKSLLNAYGAEKVFGVRGGYWGFREGHNPPMDLTHAAVSGIQHLGGTMLGSSRGGFDVDAILAFCAKHKVSQLYIVGGDGTHRAANKVGLEALARRSKLTVAGIPKTIDNDLDLIDRSFGFDSAVEAARTAIRAAGVEARGNLPNGIGIVKLMGRHAGFIAAHATLSSGDVDLCLVPEVPIELDGMYGVLPHVERVLSVKGKAVIVVAEGAGEELVGASATVDAGGNKALPEIGPFFKSALGSYFKAKGIEVTIKYIDPSYMIRSVPANAADSMLCRMLAHNAVHGSMAGHTCFTAGLCNNRLVYLPIPAMVEHSPRGLRPNGRTWSRVLSLTGQPNRPTGQVVGAAPPAVSPHFERHSGIF